MKSYSVKLMLFVYGFCVITTSLQSQTSQQYQDLKSEIVELKRMLVEQDRRISELRETVARIPGQIIYPDAIKSSPTAQPTFRIKVETTNDGIKLTGEEGCAWKELTFNLSRDDKSKVIDQYGMTSLQKSGKKVISSNLANFLITITKNADGISLEGLEGTLWKRLSYNCSETCQKTIDQSGMTDSNK